MKKMTIVLAALLLTVLAATSAFAQVEGGVSYAVGVQIKNLDNSNAANVTVTYYNQSDGSEQGSISPPAIPAGGSFTMATLDGVDAGFNGSAVVSSDREIAAIANVFGNGFSGMGASYTAFVSGDTSASLPLILRDHYSFNTWFNVQNTGSAAANVTITYDNNSTETATIQPGAAKTFDQAGNSALTDPDTNSAAGYVGSAVVSSDGDVVATLLQQGPTTLLGYDGFRTSDSSVMPVMPLINTNNFGYMTGVQIQNVGSDPTDVTVSYTASLAGSDCTETLSIPAGGSATFALNAFTSSNSGENCANGETFVGSASVTTNSASQNLVAIVNQLNSADQKGASYGAFNPANGSSAVELPLIMDRNFSFWTGFAIANVGTQATTVTCTYTDNTHTDTGTIQPGGAMTIQNINNLADQYVGAATCTATGGDASIVGVVNELGNDSSSDSFLVYEGTNR